MGFSIGNITSGVGSFLNDITGVTSSANQAYKQNLALANLSNAYAKEFAQNAHQWEADDFEKAGFNRALTTGTSSAGSIASAGGNGNSGTPGTSAMSPIDIISALNQTSATKHTNSLQEAQSKFADAQAIATIEMLPINKKEKEAYIKWLNERARGYSHSESEETSESESKDHGWNFGGNGNANIGKGKYTSVGGGGGLNMGKNKASSHSKTTRKSSSDTW